MRPITIGYWVSSASAIAGIAIANALYMQDPRTGLTDWRFTIVSAIGILLAILTLWLTNYYTHPNSRSRQ